MAGKLRIPIPFDQAIAAVLKVKPAPKAKSEKVSTARKTKANGGKT